MELSLDLKIENGLPVKSTELSFLIDSIRREYDRAECSFTKNNDTFPFVGDTDTKALGEAGYSKEKGSRKSENKGASYEFEKIITPNSEMEIKYDWASPGMFSSYIVDIKHK